MMEDKDKPAQVVVTDAWRKEQQAKRDAYQAKRRAWVQQLENADHTTGDEIPTPGAATATSATEAGSVIIPERRGRLGGTIQDKRQARFTF
jgi:hypothetical protein